MRRLEFVDDLVGEAGIGLDMESCLTLSLNVMARVSRGSPAQSG